jgi:cytochrome c6
MKNVFFIGLLCGFMSLFFVRQALNAADLQNGQTVFNNTCAGCHKNGGNTLNPEKTLDLEALEKFGLNSLEALKKQITEGKTPMPAFKGILSEKQIEDVAHYVLQQAKTGW